ncbi:hypothetical protein BSKO_14147 [Bryopsis sp. KO-2023]|nr:hypothetical protein BSKO_14147 [Bryopsis sp. KO-2023]
MSQCMVNFLRTLMGSIGSNLEYGFMRGISGDVYTTRIQDASITFSTDYTDFANIFLWAPQPNVEDVQKLEVHQDVYRTKPNGPVVVDFDVYLNAPAPGIHYYPRHRVTGEPIMVQPAWGAGMEYMWSGIVKTLSIRVEDDGTNVVTATLVRVSANILVS